jgi:hypothetical protein
MRLFALFQQYNHQKSGGCLYHDSVRQSTPGIAGAGLWGSWRIAWPIVNRLISNLLEIRIDKKSFCE